MASKLNGGYSNYVRFILYQDICFYCSQTSSKYLSTKLTVTVQKSQSHFYVVVESFSAATFSSNQVHQSTFPLRETLFPD